MDILGGVVLIDTNGEPYKAPGTLTSDTIPVEVIGGVVLIDPTTGEPYNV